MDRVKEVCLQVNSLYTSPELQKIIIPLAKKIISLHHQNKTVIVGLQGGQGTGKTTLSVFLKKVIVALGYKVQQFSIDDFYESYAFRRKLQQKYAGNPFYQISRGMPGTHRVKFLQKTLQQMKAGKNFTLPVFDKSLHNALGDIAQEIPVKGRQDFILFDGWCVGMPVVSVTKLLQICLKNNINLLKLDPELKYSKVVLSFARKYITLWKYIDYFIMLKPASSDLHKQWRFQQEQELRAKTGRGMSKTQVEQFVEVFLPFTYVCYEEIKPDVTILIDKKHKMSGKK